MSKGAISPRVGTSAHSLFSFHPSAEVMTFFCQPASVSTDTADEAGVAVEVSGLLVAWRWDVAFDDDEFDCVSDSCMRCFLLTGSLELSLVY